IENDLLESVIALPNQLFYNTGISTYIWILSNHKDIERKGKVQLINAVEFYKKMSKSLGDKRNELSEEHIQEITTLYGSFEENGYCKIFDNTDFGYAKVTVERPLIENGKVVTDKKGKPKADAKLRDTENIPLKEDISTYMQREVLPHVPDAWVDEKKTKIGYEINFTKYFYKYKPLRPLADIRADILALEQETDGLIKKVLQ
ncbi:N-6 DNA methylase, partial [Tenacibaculum singaporense]|uniref:N-6 DNA methylase n=1 Tax=Tenacibaculum singaporense TaxID=2358479 RepID=UPI003514C6B4